MAPVEVLGHTADLRLRIIAVTLPTLFAEALRGMTEASAPTWADEREIRREISVRSADQSALLVDFLSEALRLGDTYNEAYSGVVFDELNDTSLTGRLLGRKITGLSLEIKAVTYHEAKVTEENGQWTTNLVFDI